MSTSVNLVCPIRGELGASYFAKDGLTVTEEARRIDCIKYLLRKKYPKTHFQCETVIIKKIGNQGRNSLRADIVVYDKPATHIKDLPYEERNSHVVLIAEIKRENKSKSSAVSCQLEPALKQIDKKLVYGVYWDDINRNLYVKKIENNEVVILTDSLGNIPIYGNKYKYKKLKYTDLIQPEDISATLMDIANILRSNHINDDATRYRETVKLLLAKYVDEREARESGDDLILQVVLGDDVDFMDRVKTLYSRTARIYSKAKSIFNQHVNFLDEKPLREIVKKIQGLELLNSSSDSMQQVFMTFVPAVFKKDLDQYFTPLTLINCMVNVLRPGPNDKVADPAMGTADFLTEAMQFRLKHNDGQIINRVYGSDKDPQAFELAVINMILNKDGQTNLHNKDTIEDSQLWSEQMDITFCNPPFGAKTLETRRHVLRHYDLGHEWEQEKGGTWIKTDRIRPSQQIGILFIERCYKLLAESGRMGIILPEGYLCTASYGYLRQWLLDSFRILGLVELPRRIFLKSDADLRSNILFAVKSSSKLGNYPIHTELVRKVGYKLGKGFFSIPLRDPETGLEKRDEDNTVIIDTDFTRVKNNFIRFIRTMDDLNEDNWKGAWLKDIAEHPFLDMKPRRLSYKALENISKIKYSKHVKLSEIADILETPVDFEVKNNEMIHLVEGQNIRAVEGVIVLRDAERKWQVEVRKTNRGYKLQDRDVVVGLVRPERRNIAFYLNDNGHVYGSPDGVAVIREKATMREKYPIEWIFHALRTESCRLQFWTESGGTSYGKLTLDQIKNVLIPVPGKNEIAEITSSVKDWAQTIKDSSKKFHSIWSAQDKVTILNSPLIGLEYEDVPMLEPDDGE